MNRVFVINPGSTSTKLALLEGDQTVFVRELQHDKGELADLGRVKDQRAFRMHAIRAVLAEENVDASTIDGVAGRGGLLAPLEGGVYKVSDDMIDDLLSARYGEHPCNLGAPLANELAQEWSVPAYIVDPVVTDEMEEVARYTGLPTIRRRSLFHALNQRGAARTAASRLGVTYEQSDFLVAHMGGGISIGAHRQGRVVDVVNALDGEGPFSPERTGGLPVIPVLDMIERGERTPSELKHIIMREGGLWAHLGTNDLRVVEERMEKGDETAAAAFGALAYGIAKNLTSLLPALADEQGNVAVAAVVLTGGLARSERFMAEMTRLTRCMGPVVVVTGEEEMAALAAGALRALRGEEKAKEYQNVS